MKDDTEIKVSEPIVRKQVAEECAKENDASAKGDKGDNGDKDSIEKIRIEIASRVKTKKTTFDWKLHPTMSLWKMTFYHPCFSCNITFTLQTITSKHFGHSTFRTCVATCMDPSHFIATTFPSPAPSITSALAPKYLILSLSSVNPHIRGSMMK